MNPLQRILSLPETEKAERGLCHTPAEIKQQPATWRKTFDKVARHKEALDDFLSRAGVRNADAAARPAVFLIGAGTSDYVGRAVAALLRQRWQCEVLAVPSTDLLIAHDDYLRHEQSYLWVSFSRSGESSEGVALIRSALERCPNVRHLLVTCNADSSMARDFAADERVFRLVLDDEVNDRGLAMTSSFTNMVIAGHCLAHLDELPAYGEILRSLIGAGDDLLGRAPGVVEQLIAEGAGKVCFLGTGPLQAAAVESALKVLELTAGRVTTLSESYLGVRHGPLSAVDRETLVVAYLSGEGRRRGYELDLIREIQRKGLTKKILLVAARPEEGERNLPRTLAFAGARDLPDFYRPPIDVMLGQLLGLFLSLENGLRPDVPSPTGVISRVVTQVKIY